MVDKNEMTNELDNTDTIQAYQAAVDILADIVRAYLTAEKTKEPNSGRTGGFGSTGPAVFVPMAA